MRHARDGSRDNPPAVTMTRQKSPRRLAIFAARALVIRGGCLGATMPPCCLSIVTAPRFRGPGVQISMRIRLVPWLAALLAGCALAAAAAPAQAALLISVDKSTQTMTVAEDGATLYTWPVSTGAGRYDTPAGEWKPFRMEKDHYSKEWDDAPMPNSIFFTMKGHAIHGTNHKIDGAPHSHGCVRLSVANSEKLWDLVKKNKMANTRVVLTGSIPDAAPAVARRSAPARTVNRVYSTDEFGRDVVVVDPQQQQQQRQRVIGGWRETAGGDVYVDDRPRGLIRPAAPRYADPRQDERRYYVVPRDGYEVPAPRYYYYNGR